MSKAFGFFSNKKRSNRANASPFLHLNFPVGKDKSSSVSVKESKDSVLPDLKAAGIWLISAACIPIEKNTNTDNIMRSFFINISFSLLFLENNTLFL